MLLLVGMVTAIEFLWMSHNLCGRGRIDYATSFAVAVLTAAFISLSPTRATALGDFETVADSFWSAVVDSYWWKSIEDHRKIYAIVDYHDQVSDTLAEESVPVGLVKISPSRAPTDENNVSCADFKVVEITDVHEADRENLPFRVHHPKSALYLSYSGFLKGFGWPSKAEFWIAAMLPSKSEPLFNQNGIGLNQKVISRPYLVELGYENGLAAMPAQSLVLKSVAACQGFSLFNVEFVK